MMPRARTPLLLAAVVAALAVLSVPSAAFLVGRVYTPIVAQPFCARPLTCRNACAQHVCAHAAPMMRLSWAIF